MAWDIHHATLGIIGLGRIGSAVAHRALAFHMKVLYCDAIRNGDLERQYGYQFADLDTLLRESDFLTLHVPLTLQTHHYIGAAELRQMKPTAVLINAARGPVVDEKALVQALREKWIFGAGLDVFENEPALEPGLTELDNVVIVPHIASATTGTRLAMGEIAIGNVRKVLNGLPPDTCVNPEVLGR